MPVYYSLGNFLSHQKEKMNLLGGMASVTIVKDADGNARIGIRPQPTINVILRNENTGWYTYRPMLWTATTRSLPPRTASPNAPSTPCGRCMRISQDKKEPRFPLKMEAGACYM